MFRIWLFVSVLSTNKLLKNLLIGFKRIKRFFSVKFFSTLILYVLGMIHLECFLCLRSRYDEISSMCDRYHPLCKRSVGCNGV